MVKRQGCSGGQPCKFFRNWLLTASSEDIEKNQKKYEKELDSLHKNLLKLTWYMRGGVTISELHGMPLGHIKYINSIIEDNYEMSKKAGTPIL